MTGGRPVPARPPTRAPAGPLRAEATVYATGKDPDEGWRLVVERPNVLRKA